MPPTAPFELETMPGLDRTLERFEAWWHCEIVDRPPVSMSLRPDQPIRLPPVTYASERQRWMDVEGTLDRFEKHVAARRYISDLLPTFMPNLGPDICAATYGCELEFGPTTSWSKPIAANCEQVLQLTPNLQKPYWALIRRFTDESLERGRGKWITGYTDLHPNGDLLAALREPQELLLEMAENPEAVKAAMRHLTPHFKLMYDDLVQRIRAAAQPTLSWIPVPHQGRMNISSCDLICMISCELFHEMILPALQWEMEQVDRSIFHLDGPGAVRHLDSLLACKRLHAIQWVAGAGSGPASRWTGLYQRIQAGGKAMQIICDDIGEARKLMEHLKPEGCWFDIIGEYTEAEIHSFLAEVGRWSVRR